MTVGAVIVLSVHEGSKISATLTMNSIMPALIAELRAREKFSDPNGSGYPSLATLGDYGFIPYYSTYKPHVDTAFEYQVTRGQA